MKNRNLIEPYDIDWFVDKGDFPRLMSLLKKVDIGKRLSDKEVVWLKTACEDVEGYYTHSLKLKYHEKKATFYERDFHKTGNPWSIINASSHYSKCESPKNAIISLKKTFTRKLINKKVQCANHF